MILHEQDNVQIQYKMLSDDDATKEIRMADENMHIIPAFTKNNAIVDLDELK